jgi:hypothetical protein
MRRRIDKTSATATFVIPRMAKGKATQSKPFKKTRRERGPPAESVNDVAGSFSSLSVKENSNSFPIPLAMWVSQLFHCVNGWTSTTAIQNDAVGRN